MRMTPEQQIQEELDAMARARMNKRIAELENALADARRDYILLMRLVERMGKAVDTLTEWYCNDGALLWGGHIDTAYPLTIIGQREYDAAMHEAEGPPPDAGMLEAVQ